MHDCPGKSVQEQGQEFVNIGVYGCEFMHAYFFVYPHDGNKI